MPQRYTNPAQILPIARRKPAAAVPTTLSGVSRRSPTPPAVSPPTAVVDRGNWFCHTFRDVAWIRAIGRGAQAAAVHWPSPSVTKPSTKTIARAMKKAAAVDHRSPHVCDIALRLDASTKVVPLLPPIDQWGALPLPLQRLSPHSLSRRVRDLLNGDLGAHRDLPVDPDPEPVVAAPETPPVITPAPSSGYNAGDAAAAWARRRRELEHLAGITDVLTDVERASRRDQPAGGRTGRGLVVGSRFPGLRTRCGGVLGFPGGAAPR